MDEDLNPATTAKTAGIAAFGEGESGRSTHRLFRVEPGHSAVFALEQSAVLMGCVHRLTLQAGIEQDAALVWAAHYLSGMAKALVEDVAHGMGAEQ
ncbi:DUF3077 domain-containing protein [Pseudomonas rubra]|uniref:DUF3077 domain-containing protein n=1 Tax=Pseudomonas rubra TaxID=2942627 RepID=A0ABT5PDV5_9PSED|nr:DUF3077 domain-containing protein [Pseudomonas rubra]MDD1016496.1 DUF3077 domain-containing protein [Pseudomonas rubra]MDD1038498.1 DUF3077 domain-containing protein [Pseudomonas rubra]MDD1157816.1 DUF3077 domain-containing protein [Pseudomonas rubra]